MHLLIAVFLYRIIFLFQFSSLQELSTPALCIHFVILDCFRKIISEEGVLSLWNGTAPSLMLVCNPTIQFVMYEALKRRFVRMLGTQELGSLTLFLIGAVAKAVATVVTYPVQVLQSRLRVC